MWDLRYFEQYRNHLILLYQFTFEAIKMKTYLTIIFNSEGGTPSTVRDQLLNLGFKVTKGNYDFVYDWGKEEATKDELVWFADKVHSALKNTNVYFTIETV